MFTELKRNFKKVTHKNANSLKDSNSGQALVTLLVFTTIAIIITGGAVAIALATSQGNTAYTQSIMAFNNAESGVENALIELIRTNTYEGEILNLDNGTVTITVTGLTNKIITSTATVGRYVRTIQVEAELYENNLELLSWKEIYL